MTLYGESDVRTHRTPKTERAKWPQSLLFFAKALRVRACPRVALTIVFVALIAAVRAEDLPRKSKGPRESYPNVDVIYDSVAMPDGKRLRSIITKPRGAKEKLAVIFLAGWLSCDSVEAPADTKDTIGLILRGDGKRLRSIITKPRGAKEKLPVIFLTGWLSCDSVEAP